MRIQLTLRPLDRECRLPINYQYPLSCAIYKILETASPEYAAWLHDRGYTSPDGKPLRMFAFSRLFIPDLKHRGNILIAQNYTPCTLFLSSPMLDDFIPHFVTGLFASRDLTIGNYYTIARFQVEEVQTLPPLSLLETGDLCAPASFHCLSPIVASTKADYRGKLSIHYFRPDDPHLPESLRQNLLRKFYTLNHRPPRSDTLFFQWDTDYIHRRGGYDKISKLITIKEGEQGEETRVKSFIAPFTLSGSPELIDIAYECGLGEKNSLGFGMIELKG